MSTCSACATPSLDTFYSTAGDTLCRPCYSQSQIQAQNQRAIASVAASGPMGLPRTMAPETPSSQTRNGFIALAVCVGTTVLSVMLLDKIYFWSPIVGVGGLVAFSRALALKKQRRESAALVIVGIVLTVVVVLAIALLLIA